MSAPVRLTQFAQGGGCACKIPAGDLERIVAGLCRPPAAFDPAAALLVGLDSGDDAAVVAHDQSTAIVATADFFTPVVDDDYDWGRIAAANARLGTGVLNSRHKATGEVFAEAVESMADEGPREPSEKGPLPR